MILPNFDFPYLCIITRMSGRHFTLNTITDFHFYCNIISKILHFSVTIKTEICNQKEELRRAPPGKSIFWLITG